MEVCFKPTFVRQFKILEDDLQEEVLEKIELLKSKNNHRQLKVHKLSGRLKDRYSFSVNYKIRIVFKYETKSKAVLLAIGSHDVYKK
ncbi:MAG: type II toxin-antitoxin system mRNA interferase toxin, RelE/StbE family [Candidatus Pacebacteria bacterium]|nr:type II toxin-antitoxin system mRNA interferase toxin, RelE/StbE family [Candidatus Paceibacterota bacterium]